MTLILNVNYNNAANFIFDANDVEVDGSGARLKLQFFPEQDFTEDFADDTGFTYDANKSEFIGGVVRQKDQTPAEQIIAAKYAVDANANWSKAGGATAVLNGAPTIVAGKLVCTGAQGARYQLTDNLYAAGAMKCKYTPGYTGAPAANTNIMSIEQRSGAGNNRLLLFHSPSGDNFRVYLTDGASNNILAAATIGASGINLSAATQYEIELNWDQTAGNIYLFLGGTLHGTLSPGAWSFNAETMDLTVGATTNVYDTTNASFDDVTLYNAVQHTAGYTPGYTLLDFIYAETNITLPIFTYNGPGELEPAGPPTSTESGVPRYIIQGKYWDGDSWENSDNTYAQATSKADIIANIATFPNTGLSTITVIVVFGDSNIQSSVDQIDFSVVGQEYSQTNPNIRPNSFSQVDGLIDFSIVGIVSGSDEIRHVIERRSALGGASSYFYWDGAVWVTSDLSLAQANTEAELATNLPSLDLSAGYYIRIVSLLHSNDGYSTPEITSISFEYDFTVSPSAPNTVILYGWLRNAKNEPLQGTVYIEIIEAFKHTGLIFPISRVSEPTNSEGYFEFDGANKIVETATISKNYRVRIVYEDPIREDVSETIIVPDQESVNLDTLIFLP